MQGKQMCCQHNLTHYIYEILINYSAAKDSFSHRNDLS